MAVSRKIRLCAVGLLLCGAVNTTCRKVAYSLRGTSADGELEDFRKPWFFTFVMFAGMSMSLCVDRLERRFSVLAGSATTTEEVSSLLSPRAATVGNAKEPWRLWKIAPMLAVPAVLDLLGNGLTGVALLHITASVWQLFRGSSLLFGTLLSVAFLRRKPTATQWLGVALCMAGITLVGVAVLLRHRHEGPDASAGSVPLLGVGLVLLGQLVDAASHVAEESLMKDFKVPPLQVVGCEGVCGGLVMLLIGFPILFMAPGGDHGSRSEDVLDTLALLRSSLPLRVLAGAYCCSVAATNICGIAVTGALSAVHRLMIEGCRTSVVWVFGLIVHYFLDPSSPFGERWTVYSWIQVLGFVVLLAGQAVYGGSIHVAALESREDAATKAEPAKLLEEEGVKQPEADCA